MADDKAKKCTKCELSNNCKNALIFGKGSHPKQTDIMIIQDMPSFFDDRCGEAPTGDTRGKLNYFFEKAGINYKRVYFTSAVKCSTKKATDIKGKHLNACRNYLLAEILQHKPKVIITMGKVAHEILMERSSVAEFAGHFDDFTFNYETNIGNDQKQNNTFSCKILPTYSLQNSLKGWQVNGDVIHHFKKAKLFAEEGIIERTPDPEINLILSLEALYDWRDRMLATTQPVATDFETTGFSFTKDVIINAGYCAEPGKADIIYLAKYKKEHTKKWTKKDIVLAFKINKFLSENEFEIWSVVKEVHNNPNIRWALHNGKFDQKFAMFNDIEFANFYFDTLVADSLIDENVRHSLNLCLERRDINYGAYDTKLWPYVNKDENKKKSYQWVPPTLLVKYLGYDVDGDKRLQLKQVKELEREEMTNHFFQIKMPSLRHVTGMEYIGVRMNRKLIEKTSIAIQKKQDELQKELVRITGLKDFNPNSPKQIIEYMIEAGYPFAKLKIKQTKTGFSTSAEELKKFMVYKKYEEFPKVLMDVKKLAKIRGTYVDGKKGEGGLLQYLDDNDRVHANFNLWTPVTGRQSCNKPSLQVWPRPIAGLPNTRNFVRPKKGWKLFSADYSALEMYVVAALSGDKEMIKQLKAGVDIHSYNAVKLGHTLGIVDKSVTYEMFLDNIGKGKLKKEEIDQEIYLKYNELRTRAKSIAFGLNYGKGASSFAEEFKISEDEAQEMIDAYFEIYKGLKKWRDGIVKQALTKGYIKLLSGRKRRFTMAIDWLKSEHAEGLWSAKSLSEEISRQAMNFPVQGGAHEVFEPAYLRLTTRFKEEGMKARLILLIHDDIVGECPEDELQRVGQMILDEMPTTLNDGTDNELRLVIEPDFYESCWYSDKIKLDAA